MKITKEFKVIEQLAAWEGGSTLNGSWFKFWSREGTMWMLEIIEVLEAG
jgi:hypothetical protein